MASSIGSFKPLFTVVMLVVLLAGGQLLMVATPAMAVDRRVLEGTCSCGFNCDIKCFQKCTKAKNCGEQLVCRRGVDPVGGSACLKACRDTCPKF
ncbi:hypothetical protein ACP4OV_015177 [Aristida adscensionis]